MEKHLGQAITEYHVTSLANRQIKWFNHQDLSDISSEADFTAAVTTEQATKC